MSAPLEILVTPAGGSLSLRVRGEVDFSNVDVLMDAIDSADAEADLLVDLSETTFLDLRGLDALARCSDRRAASGRTLTIVDPPPSGERMLREPTLGHDVDWRAGRR